jgi:signal transduction histidine kinase
MLSPSITEKAIKVEFEPPEDLPAVHIDRALFEQALLAILANAIEASPRKGQLVVLAESDANGTVSISVQDEGEGIPNDIRHKVFDQFFSTKPKRVGLGLTIAHRIITLHGGRIEIESQPEQGTRVRIHLPASAKR